jgi:hypothetical protein
MAESLIDLRNYIKQNGRPYIKPYIGVQIKQMKQGRYALSEDAYDPGDPSFKIQGTLKDSPPYNMFETSSRFFTQKEIPNGTMRPWTYRIDLNTSDPRCNKSVFPRQSWIPQTIDQLGNIVYKDGVPRNPGPADLMGLSTLTDRQKEEIRAREGGEAKRTSDLLARLVGIVEEEEKMGGGFGGGIIGSGIRGGIGSSRPTSPTRSRRSSTSSITTEPETIILRGEKGIEEIKEFRDLDKLLLLNFKNVMTKLMKSEEVKITEEDADLLLEKLGKDLGATFIPEIIDERLLADQPVFNPRKGDAEEQEILKGRLGYLRTVIRENPTLVDVDRIDSMINELNRIKPKKGNFQKPAYKNYLGLIALLSAIKQGKGLNSDGTAFVPNFIFEEDKLNSKTAMVELLDAYKIGVPI